MIGKSCCFAYASMACISGGRGGTRPSRYSCRCGGRGSLAIVLLLTIVELTQNAGFACGSMALYLVLSVVFRPARRKTTDEQWKSVVCVGSIEYGASRATQPSLDS